MATINNSEIQKRITEEAKLQLSVDAVPTQLAEKVVPVLISNPKPSISVVVYKSGSGTSYTTPSNKRFFLCGCSLSIQSVAVTTSGNSTLTIVPKNGVSAAILALVAETTAAITSVNENQVIDFARPIELEKGSAVGVTIGGSLTNVKSTLWGYILEE